MLPGHRAAREPDRKVGVARDRDLLFLAAAVLIHAAGLLSTGVIARGAPRLGPSLRAPLELAEAAKKEFGSTEIDLLADEPEASPASALRPPVDASIATRAPARRLANAGPLLRERQPEAQTEPGPSPSPAPAASAPAADPGWLPNEDPGPTPGLNGPPVWAIPGVLTAPSATGGGPLVPRAEKITPKNPTDDPKRTALFPGAGALASAVADEVASSSAPLTSESHFVLTLDAQGRLVSAAFLSANEGERATWERIARAVSKRFTGKSITLPEAFAGGGKVYVSVSSRASMPDGTDHGTPAPRSLLEKAPADEYSRIESPLNDRFRSPLTNTSAPPNTIMGGIPFTFDVANIGASRRRVVRAQVRAVPTATAAAPSP